MRCPRLALTEEGAPRARFTKAQGLPADDPDAKALGQAFAQHLERLDMRQVAALHMIGVLPDPIVPEKARGALDALAKLLLMAAAQLTRIFNEQGECDHSEVAGAARQALTQDSSPTPLAERLGTRIRHILVDEFQDTSRDQYDLLLTLTQDWSEGDGRTLFLVGDPMQSIYGFRNAEVGRFSTVRGAGLGAIRLQPLELRRNFRSAPALVHWCNEVFARVFPEVDDVRRSAVRHLASVAARPDLEGKHHLYRVACRLWAEGGGRSGGESHCRAGSHPAGRERGRAGRRTWPPARDSRGARSARRAVHRRESRTPGRCAGGARPGGVGARAGVAARPRGLAGGAARALRRIVPG